MLVRALSGVEIKQVAVGWSDSSRSDGFCVTAMTTNGEVYSCGQGKETGDQPEPLLVSCFDGSKAAQVVTSQHHSVAVTVDGSVYSWGCGKDGRLGHGNETNCFVPTLVQALEPETLHNDKIKQVACGCS